MSESSLPVSTDPQPVPGQPARPAASPPKRRLAFWRNPRFWAIMLLLVGLVIIVRYGQRTLRSYREFTYAREQGLLDGSASVAAIRPWMTVRYIAVAYAVPEEYIYDQLGIPFTDRPGPRGDSIFDLARKLVPDKEPREGDDQVMARLQTIILAYRENPVAPGLRDIRPWMSMAYIANSTGVPMEYLFEQVNLVQLDNEYKPLDFLVDEQDYPGDMKALIDAVDAAVASYEEAQ